MVLGGIAAYRVEMSAPPRKPSVKRSEPPVEQAPPVERAPPHHSSGHWHMPRWLHAGLLLLVLLAVALSTWLASMQAPHPDPWRRMGTWDVERLDWWRYPLERNAFKRTLVQGNLNGVFNLPGTDQLWVVGQDGLILHSGDGGRTWVQQNPPRGGVAEAPAAVALNLLGWLPSAQAGAPQPNVVSRPQDPRVQAQQQQQDERMQQQQQPVQRQSQESLPNQALDPKPAVREAAPKASENSKASYSLKTGRPAVKVKAKAPPAAAASAFDPLRTTLQAVHFTDEKHGWAVGDHSTILATADGGGHWHRQTLPADLGDVSLRALAFSGNRGQGWVVGSAGAFLRTDDAGVSWQRQKVSGGTANKLAGDLTGIIVSPSGGTVVGSQGVECISTNGGESWALVKNSGKKSLNAIARSGGQTARIWAVGDDGFAASIGPGGEPSPVQMGMMAARLSLRGISLSADGRRGWAIADGGWLVRTNDQLWSSVIRVSGYALRGVSIDAAGERAWVVGDHGTLLVTTDGGLHWAHQAGSEAVFNDISFAADGLRGWAIGPYGQLLSTQDGGRNWQPQSLTNIPAGAQAPISAPGQLRGLYVTPNGSRVWAVGEHGNIMASGDAGVSWAAQVSPDVSDLRKIALSEDGQRGLAVGQNVILSTTDGGRRWAKTLSDGSKNLLGVAVMPDGMKGWAVGGTGLPLSLANGVKDWQATPPKAPSSKAPSAKGAMMDVAFASDGQRGWAVGEHGTALATQDGGQAWSPQVAGLEGSPDLTSVSVIGNGAMVWAAGSNALALLRNGSTNWEPQKPPGGTARLVRFTPDGRRGWVVGEGASLHATTDRGLHWQPMASYERHWAPWYAVVLLLSGLAAATLLGWVESGARTHDFDLNAADGAATVLSSDQPVSDKAADRLGFRPAVEALSSFIRNAGTEPRVTLAITGEWGSGKSSIMRMLQTDLQQAGFRTAWFNAWHHQQEGRQLAALFNVVRQQSVPQLWRQPIGWLRVRSRLIWGRGFFYQTVAVAMAVVLAVAAGDLFSVGSEQALDNLRLNVKHHVLQERQTIVTGSTLDKLDPFRRAQAKNAVLALTGAASGPELLAVAAAPSAPALASADPIAEALTKPTAAGAAAPVDACDNAVLKRQLQKAVPVRPEVFCYMKRALLWEPTGESQQCGDTRALPAEKRCVFARPQDLLATVKAHIEGDKLRPSEEEAILEAAETLPPPPLFPWLQRSLLGGIVGFILLLFTKGWSIGGLQIAQPLKTLLALGTGAKHDSDKEPTGTVERCRAEFGLLTEALNGRLVIFIDDLDRCSSDTVNGLMELTNYLVDVGRCFVIIGAAMDRVMLCIKPPVDGEDARTYAQAYLRKLVHIELPVPPVHDRLHELVTHVRPPTAIGHLPHPAQPPWRRALAWLWGLLLTVPKWLRRAIWLGLAISVACGAFSLGQRLQGGVEGKAQPIDPPARPVALVDTGKPGPAHQPALPVQIAAPASTPERSLPASLLSPGSATTDTPRVWWAVGLALALAGLAWRWVARYRARLTVALGGAIRAHDSDGFMRGLRLWQDVVIAHDPTPRHVKRFYNRARLFAAYEQQDVASRKLPATHEAHLVMMAALHHTDPSLLGALGSAAERVEQGEATAADACAKALGELPSAAPALLYVLQRHVVEFGGLPSAAQVERFEVRLAGLRVS
jgi:photosystem II stability/assembly factor-like uncharacterized protein